MRLRVTAVIPLAVLATACAAPAKSAAVSSPVASKPVAAAAQASLAPVAASASAVATPRPPIRPVIDAAYVAGELSSVEQAIRLPGISQTEYVGLGRREQKALLLLESHPDWVAAVLSAVPAGVRPAIQANLSAAQQIGTLNGISNALPHWQIIAPPAPDTLLAYYRQAQQINGVPWQYLAAINLIETNMGRIRGLSSAGAQGPMQFMPATWASYGRGDVNDPHDAIIAAGRYLQAHGGPADMTRAIYAYNPSMLYVRAVQLYAQQMFADARTFYAYYNWQVYVPTPSGNTLLPEGFRN